MVPICASNRRSGFAVVAIRKDGDAEISCWPFLPRRFPVWMASIAIPPPIRRIPGASPNKSCAIDSRRLPGDPTRCIVPILGPFSSTAQAWAAVRSGRISRTSSTAPDKGNFVAFGQKGIDVRCSSEAMAGRKLALQRSRRGRLPRPSWARTALLPQPPGYPFSDLQAVRPRFRHSRRFPCKAASSAWAALRRFSSSKIDHDGMLRTPQSPARSTKAESVIAFAIVDFV